MISTRTIIFLNDLKLNNNRDWFLTKNIDYKAAKQEYIVFIKTVISNLSHKAKEYTDIEASKCLFRINRDVRFSNNKAPYKTNFGASINTYGKKSPKAGLYIHIEPGVSFIGGGIYMPASDILFKVRQEIDYNTADFKKILNAKDFKTYFKELSQDDKLKTAPKGYPKDHPELNLLQHKHFIVMHPLKDSEVMDKNFPAYAAKVFKAMFPMNEFLRACME
jgi:uncharacterized protein (TIGR02453 family)